MQFSFNNVESSPFWKFYPEIKTICQPLFEHLGINYFDYTRFYPDNTCVSLSSDPYFLRYLVNKDEYLCATGRLLPGKYLWHHYIDQHFIENTQIDFDYFHGITYVKHTEGYLEEINFGASKQYANMLSLYLEKDAMLEYFIAHFLHRISPFLQQNKHFRIILPNNFVGSSELTHQKDVELQSFIHALHQQSQIRKNTFILQFDNKLVSLTQREIQCLAYLKNGFSAKLIARELNISARTVEIFLNNILRKIGYTSRIQLLANINNINSAILDKLFSII